MSRGQIDEIKSKLNIVDVVREYLPSLKHSGRNYFAVCPFHNEKSPSFSVNEDIQRFKCFGCGESGDVITFIEKYEGVDFPKALELAAKKAGVKLKRSKSFDSKYTKEKEDLQKVNFMVSEYFNYILTKHSSGKLGKAYLEKRNLKPSTVERFKIGYAPDGFQNLKTFLIKKGFKDSDLVKWSLLAEKNNHTYDKFRKRLMFPIRNHVGDVVGFSGRVVDNNDIPKYLNSSETLVYKKSNVVYGLYEGKEAIRKKKFVIIVEGNVDVPMAHQFGIENIVAPMGTALTESQLKLISRYADEIYFSLDSDSAGEKALVRSFEIAEKLGLASKAIDLGEYGDLDEFLNKDSESALKAIEKAKPVVENLINRIYKRINPSSARDKSNFVKEISQILVLVKNEVELTHYVQKIARLVAVEEQIIWNAVKDKPGQTANVTRNSRPVQTQKVQSTSDFSLKEKHLLAFVLQFNLKDKITGLTFSNNQFTNIFEKFDGDVKNLIDSLDEELKELVTDLTMMELGDFDSDGERDHFFDELVSSIKRDNNKSQISKLKLEIARKEELGEEVEEEITKLHELMKKIR